MSSSYDQSSPVISLIVSFFLSLSLYVFVILYSLNNNTLTDKNSIRIVIFYLRLSVSIEILTLLFLTIVIATLGNPLSSGNNYSWIISPGVSWIYYYFRPITGVLLIGLGLFANVHLFFRLVTCAGCILEIITDCISANEVYVYYRTVTLNLAPQLNYSASELFVYVIRDYVSFGLSFLIFMLTLHLSVCILLNPSSVSVAMKYSYDRNEVMQIQRRKRNN